ncbi:MAG: 50S ribosomal protein L13 [Planctomycetota bacterium]|jgi:large subunit ribosomal protein L13
MTKTTFASEADNQAAMAKWFIVDASKHVLGRMAVGIAEVLMGKHSPLYTPHLNVGNGVIVINAEKVGITGNKRDTKVYRRYSGYPGGLKEASLGDCMEQSPDELVKLAVRRMLPKSRLAYSMLKRLKVYAGAEHPHAAQNPEDLDLKG